MSETKKPTRRSYTADEKARAAAFVCAANQDNSKRSWADPTNTGSLIVPSTDLRITRGVAMSTWQRTSGRPHLT